MELWNSPPRRKFGHLILNQLLVRSLDHRIVVLSMIGTPKQQQLMSRNSSPPLLKALFGSLF
jgi:hypothetical protein